MMQALQKKPHPKVVVLVGPNASGKTKLAVALARRYNGEIISADSRQVYRGMDIGTGKDLDKFQIPNSQFPIRHHLIDVCSPRRQFTVAKFQQLAYRAIEDILQRGKLPIICGGTGLYVDAVVQGYQLRKFQIPNSKFQKIRRRLNHLNFWQLLTRLKKVDPATYEVIDRKNRRRVERALEIYDATGKPKSAQQVKVAPPYDFLQLGVAVSRPILHQRINRRLRQRLDGGMIAEVRRLHRQGISWRKLDAFGLEYRWISRYLRGAVSRTGMETRLLSDIKHYARRQMTWFRRNKHIHWISSFRLAQKIVAKFLSSFSAANQ